MFLGGNTFFYRPFVFVIWDSPHSLAHDDALPAAESAQSAPVLRKHVVLPLTPLLPPLSPGVLLLVDSVEGPMPQTRFVLRKALALNKKVGRSRRLAAL